MTQIPAPLTLHEHSPARLLLAIAVATLGVGTVLGVALDLMAAPIVEIPDDTPSVEMLLTIFRSNMVILIALAGCAVLQRYARNEVASGSKPWIRTLTDLVITVFVVLNVFAIGFAIGQLQLDAMVRIIPHAWLEVPAFLLGIWGYLLARENRLTTKTGLVLYGTAAILLAVGAVIETYVTGSI